MLAILTGFILSCNTVEKASKIFTDIETGFSYRKMTSTKRSHAKAGNHYVSKNNCIPLQEMIDSTEEIIITMPAKAAGSSFKTFAAQCYGKDWVKDNYLNFINSTGMKWLTGSYELPKVMASHMYREENFVHLIKNAPNGALVIYSHREETDRVLSAINQVVTSWCGADLEQGPRSPPPFFFSKRDGNNCFVSEKNLINLAIKQRAKEIGIGSTRILTCTVYDTLKNNAPNFFFMDFRKASELMNRVAEKYCPDLVGKPVQLNIADKKRYDVFVQLEHNTSDLTTVTPLKEWMRVKRGHLELFLGLNNDATCVSMTRMMEKMLFSSDNGFVSAADVIKQFDYPFLIGN